MAQTTSSSPYDEDRVSVDFRIAEEPFDFLFELDPGLVVLAIILSIVFVLYLANPIRRRALP